MSADTIATSIPPTIGESEVKAAPIIEGDTVKEKKDDMSDVAPSEKVDQDKEKAEAEEEEEEEEEEAEEAAPATKKRKTSSTKAKAKKEIVDSGPKRPQTAFLLFVASIREKLKAKGLSMTDIAKEGGKQWAKLADKGKKPFESEHQRLKAAYLKEKAKWEAAHPSEETTAKKTAGGKRVAKAK